MKSKLINDAREKTFVLVFETGDEVTAGLLDFAKQHKLAAAHFTAIGAFQDLTLGYFDWQRKEYEKIPMREQVEVLSMVGNIVETDKGPKLHAHVVVGKRDGSAHGGHLVDAHVRPTLEVMLVESPSHLRRRHDDASGLALIKL
ncbi:MAG TPA: PPC domain-containing DNA-binding protein [Pirellulales bacterium]|nr:PPC domain-containing DNA-binding protein [Pirellulales bacterium]